MSSLGSKQRTSTTANTVQTPTVAPFLSSGHEALASKASGLLTMSPSSFTTGAAPNQTQAFARAAQGTGNPTGEAEAATRGLLSYTPQRLADTNLQPYTDPYENDVVNTTLSDIDWARQRAINVNTAGMSKGSQFGSRAGVADSLTNGEFARTAASTAAGLRSAGFDKAQAGAKYDLDRDDQGAVFRSQIAKQLADINLAGAANYRSDTAQQAELGESERQINQQTNPNVALVDLLNSYGGILGQIPTGAYTSQTSNQSGTSTMSGSPGLLEILGTVADVAGALTGNPFKTKTGGAK